MQITHSQFCMQRCFCLAMQMLPTIFSRGTVSLINTFIDLCTAACTEYEIAPPPTNPPTKTLHSFTGGTAGVPQTYHSAVGHGALGSARALAALPPLWVSVRRLADLEEVPGGSGAVFAPIRRRTHAYTSTAETALRQNGFGSRFLPAPPPPPLHIEK